MEAGRGGGAVVAGGEGSAGEEEGPPDEPLAGLDAVGREAVDGDVEVSWRPRALDLFCRAGGISEGLRRAGFDVVGVDILDCSKAYKRGPGNPEHENPARFVQADALKVLDGLISGWAGNEALAASWGRFDLICASPPCQAHSTLRHLVKGKEYPNLIPQTRERLRASGIPYVIENVPGAPLEGKPLVLCGTMFGLETPDRRAELRRHRHFETSFPVTLRPECRHGKRVCICTGHTPQDQRAVNERRRAISVVGNTAEMKLEGWTGKRVICVGGGKAMSGGMMTPQGELKRRAVISVTGDRCNSGNTQRRAVSVTGNTAQTNVERNTVRETFSVEEARAAMGIPWMAMKDLSQAIPPAYSHFIGLMFLGENPTHLLAAGGCMASLF